MKIIILNFLVSLVAITVTNAVEKKNVMCYVASWATYYHGNGKFDLNDLCTHLLYSFFGITENGDFRIINPYLDLEEDKGKGNIKKFNDLKKTNPKLKTLATVGGWDEGSLKFSQVAKDPIKRHRFINSTIQFVLKHNFDGIEMHWKHPGQRDGDPEVDKSNFVTWLKEFRQEVDKHGLLLTAAVAPTKFLASQSYDIPNLSKYLDFINVQAYELHGSWEKTAGISAPLYAGQADVTETQKQLNVDSCIQYWLKQGAPAHKILLGVSLQGNTFTLANPAETRPGSRISGPGNPGQISGHSGYLGYYEICQKLKTEKWTQMWETEQQVPYAFKNYQWVGYDDKRSIAFKAQYVSNHSLGGIAVWSLETDDFEGVCGEKYPLMNTINKVLESEGNIPPELLITNFNCTDLFRAPYDCVVYFKYYVQSILKIF